MNHIFPFFQIPEFLNSAILCKFYFLKFYMPPRIVIRDGPGIKISKKGKARLPCYCYGEYSWCLEDDKNRVHLGLHGRPHMAASGLLLAITE